MDNRKPVTVGLLGHYGNLNMGDESIIEAVIKNLQLKCKKIHIVGLSINPGDTEKRHEIHAYPIRRLGKALKINHPGTGPFENSPDQMSGKIKQTGLNKIKNDIKTIPFLYIPLKMILYTVSTLKDTLAEIQFFFKIVNIVKKIDVLIITGSNQFLDNFGGPWGFPFTLLKWTVVAKIARIKVLYICVGAGPLEKSLSRQMVRLALVLADYVSVRDVASKRLIESLGYREHIHVFPDLAYSLRIPKDNSVNLKELSGLKKNPIIGINPMPVYDARYWCDIDTDKYNSYVKKLVDFSTKLYSNHFTFFFFSTQEKDNNVIFDILKKMNKHGYGNFPFEKYSFTSKSVNGLLENIAAADMVVATRFHGVVLSLALEKPVMGICYYRKAKDLLTAMGQEQYAMDLDHFSPDEMWQIFEILLSNIKQEKNKISAKNSEYRKLLDTQYNRLIREFIGQCS